MSETLASGGLGGGGGGGDGGSSVTSVSLSGGTTGLITSGGPITTSGTITISGTLAVANGGTGANTAAGALTALGGVTSTQAAAAAPVQSVAGRTGAVTLAVADVPGALSSITAASTYATSGANSSITSLTGLTTALSVGQGGTGSTNAANALAALGGVNATQAAAAAPVQSVASRTGAVVLTVADVSGALSSTTAASTYVAIGANSSITSLTGLTTALSVGQGGTGANTIAAARSNLGAVNRAGDTLTGAVKTTARELTDAANVAVDLTSGAATSSNMFTLLATSAIGATRALALPTGVSAGEAASLLVRFTQDGVGGRALTFASGITLQSGAIKTTAGSVSIVELMTFDGGTTWQAVIY